MANPSIQLCTCPILSHLLVTCSYFWICMVLEIPSTSHLHFANPLFVHLNTCSFYWILLWRLAQAPSPSNQSSRQAVLVMWQLLHLHFVTERSFS